MRVITHLGFGTIKSFIQPPDEHPLRVELDKPFLGQKVHLMSRREVYPFSASGVIRVLNVDGVGVLSNLQFFSDRLQRGEHIVNLQTPADETHFVFDLEERNGSVLESQQLGLGADDYLILRPWVDRWGRDRNPLWDEKASFDNEAKALQAFDQATERLAGVGGGIWSQVLYSTTKRQILRLNLTIAPPQGTIYQWRAPELVA